MKNKILKTLCFATLVGGPLTFGLTSCGGEDLSKTIVFYHTVSDAKTDQIAVFNEAVEQFKNANAGWTVKLKYIKSYDDIQTQVKNELSANENPDLAYAYPDHVVSYFKSRKVVDVNKYLTDDDKTNFVETYLNGVKSKNYDGAATYGFDDNSLLSIPFSKSTETLFYDADALKTIGVDPSSLTTWANVFDACAKWQATHTDATYRPLMVDTASNFFITNALQNGNEYTTLSGSDKYVFYNDGNKAMLEELRDKAINKKLFATPSSINLPKGTYSSNCFVDATVNGDGLKIWYETQEDGTEKAVEGGAGATQPEGHPDAHTLPSKNHAIFTVGSSAGASYYTSKTHKQNVGVLSLPGVNKDGTIHNQAISQGPDLVVLKSDKSGSDATKVEERVQKTVSFAKILTSKELQAKFSIATGYVPVNINTYSSDTYKEFLKTDKLAAKTNLAYAARLAEKGDDAYFVNAAFDGSSNARTQVGDALTNAINEAKASQSIDSILKTAYDNCKN